MKKGIRVISILLILIAGIVFSQDVSGQENRTIEGTIIDQQTLEPLPGATIMIENTSVGTTTDLNGKFRLSNIKQDKVRLVVTYIGYDPYVIEHDFTSRKKPNINVKLKSAATGLDQVEVRGKADGQVKAFIEQKEAANIKNIVSSEQIQKFPDMNAAEAMQRIPGITLQRDQGEGRFVQLRGTPPELTNFNINGEQIPSPEGNVRYVGMDIVAADQIDVIEITKVLTPDMDADGIGGTVNIITKKATSEKPEVAATLAGGYSHLRGTPNYQAQFSFGQRTGKFGFSVNGSYYYNKYGSDNMEFKYNRAPFPDSASQALGENNYHFVYQEMQLRHYDIVRKRIGLSATIDYEFNDFSFIYLRGMLNNFSDNEIRRRKVYDLEDPVTFIYYRYGGIDHDVKKRTKIQNVNTINLGGEHRIGITTLDYEAAYATASELVPDRIEAQFDNWGQAIHMQMDLTDKNWPRIEYPDEETSEYATAYDKYELNSLLFEESTVTDENLTFKANLKIPYYEMPGNNGFLKFGGKVRLKDKERDIRGTEYGAYKKTSLLYPGEGPDLSLVTVDDGFRDDNLLNHNYIMEYMPDPEKMINFFDRYQEFFIIDRLDTKRQTYEEDYKANENIYAAYLMARHDIGKLMLLGGVRFEQTEIDYEGRRVIVTKKNRFDKLDTLTDNRIHRFVLPQFQMKYSFNDKFNLRAAATYSYSRPNFEDVIPYRQQDYDEVQYGNPDLKFPTSVNIDLLTEYYLRGDGLLSGGLFYKDIDDFIFYYVRFGHEGEDVSNFPSVEITKPENGKRASVYGAEILAQSKFFFLQGLWKDFGLYVNYTFTHSEAYINKRFPRNYSEEVIIINDDVFSSSTEEEKITLPGQAKHTANLAVFFENKKIHAKLAANFHDAFLYKLGGDQAFDEYYDKAWHLDFNAHYAITENVKVFLDLINLTNQPLRFYSGEKDQIKQQEFYSWWGRIGIKLAF